MRVIRARNVNDALFMGLQELNEEGVLRESRNGPVLVAPHPVATVYENPCERVLFNSVRDANPYFHLMESMWMLWGGNDLEFPRRFNSKFGEYSDDGKTVPGAYGFRWREYFGYDQLEILIKELKKNPDSRRAVLAMWDGSGSTWDDELMEPVGQGDLFRAMGGSKDVPCNTHAYFSIDKGRLNMTVCCRSNDIIWGAYGANAVHFSFLLEYMALSIGVEVGKYTQFSNNYHLYTEIFDENKCLEMQRYNITGYSYVGKEDPVPLFTNRQEFDDDLNRFMRRDGIGNEYGWRSPFFRDTVRPMYLSWMERKDNVSDGVEWASRIAAPDWRRACLEWLGRRAKK